MRLFEMINVCCLKCDKRMRYDAPRLGEKILFNVRQMPRFFERNKEVLPTKSNAFNLQPNAF